MGRSRTVESIIIAPVHGGVMKPCLVMTESAVSTIELPEGHFTAIAISRPGMHSGAMVIIDHEEVEAMIQFLQNSIADAKRMDSGKAPIHAADSLIRH